MDDTQYTRDYYGGCLKSLRETISGGETGHNEETGVENEKLQRRSSAHLINFDEKKAEGEDKQNNRTTSVGVVCKVSVGRALLTHPAETDPQASSWSPQSHTPLKYKIVTVFVFDYLSV